MELRCGFSSVDWNSFCLGITVLQKHLWLIKNTLLFREIDTRGSYEHSGSWQTASIHLVYHDLAALSRTEENGGEPPSFSRLLNLVTFS
jgi:hypothetical protein